MPGTNRPTPANPLLDARMGWWLVATAANGVGLLILIIVAVLYRAGGTRSMDDAEAANLAAARQAANGLEGEVRRLAAETQAVQAEAALRRAERERLGTFLAAVEHELAERRAAMDEDARKQYDLDRELGAARARLASLTERKQSVKDKPDKTVKIEHYPTPISRLVDNKEIHFQLKHGRLAYVPMNEFVAKWRNTVGDKLYKLRDSMEFTETIGPIDNFTIRYTVIREDVPPDEVIREGGGTRVVLDHAEFLPVSEDMGEPVTDALANRSQFHGRLDDMNPKHTTVTLWVFADSFEQFRFFRKQLYEMGFTVAARPLADWMTIGGSQHGSKSAAE